MANTANNTGSQSPSDFNDFSDFNNLNVSVIGLGLIGGSMAYKLKSQGIKVKGFDTNSDTLQKAIAKGAIDYVSTSTADAIENADLIIIATYPDSIVKIVKENKNRFKNGAVITDICGVKSRIAKEISNALPPTVSYVGSHPMAGKEVEGFDNAEPGLFEGCGFIVVPTEKSDDKSTRLVCDMAKKLGAARIAVNNPEEHDSIIAYTSDLMHIAASALCLDFNQNMNLAYTAGAFRDCTRIAMINPTLWTELLTENSKHTLTELDRYIDSLKRFRTALANDDEAELLNLFTQVRENKTEMLSR